jgi:uncharacterized repeat protein (TIGR01451 family)
MKPKLPLFIFFAFIISIISLNTAFGYEEDSIYFSSEEQGLIISYFDNFYIVKVNGTLSIYNPSAQEIYAISLDLFFASLKLEIHNNTNRIHIQESSVIIPQIKPNSSVSFDYSLYGITSNPDVVSKDGVITSALKKKIDKINSQIVGNLYKAPLEDLDKGGRANTRLISAKFFNPSSIPYLIKDGKIIKTPPGDMNLYNEIESWSFDRKNITLKKNQQYDFDVLDTNAYEGEIYWLNTDMYLANVKFNSSVNITIYTQDDLFEILENKSNLTLNISQEIELMTDRVYLQKKVSKSHVNPGDIVEVVLLINNFGPKEIRNAELIDEIPEGFELIESSLNFKEGIIKWDDLILNSQETKRISYKLKYVDNESIGMDYFVMAKLYYDNKEILSNNVPFVRIYLPEKKLFVQKEITFNNENDVGVLIKINNLGEKDIENIVLNEFLNDDNEFREISKQFVKKGLWNIETIKSGETWEVSYTTDQFGVLNTFPVVYGIPEKNVMKTVILSNLISTEFKNSSIAAISIFGALVVLILSILMFLPADFFNFQKKADFNKLQNTKREIEELKIKTGIKKNNFDETQNFQPNNSNNTNSEKNDNTNSSQNSYEKKKYSGITNAEESLKKNEEEFKKIEQQLDMKKTE